MRCAPCRSSTPRSTATTSSTTRTINLGIAVALDWGLIVPVIKNADEMNLLGLSRAVADLANRARAQAAEAGRSAGGTFTITNPGVFGALFGMPIINQPQVAILGVGNVEKRPVVVDDAIAIRPMAYLTLGYDHRVIDGAVADEFMSHIKKTLETGTERCLRASRVSADARRSRVERSTLEVRRLGVVPYAEALALQRALVEERRAGPHRRPAAPRRASARADARRPRRRRALAHPGDRRSARRARRRGARDRPRRRHHLSRPRPDRRLSDHRSQAGSLRRPPLRPRPRRGADSDGVPTSASTPAASTG